ncbi:hypothetical protein ACWDA3_41180 [Nonomuraea rubra]
MNTAVKLGSYALGLAVVFGGTLGVGNAVGPVRHHLRPRTTPP